MRSNYPDSLCLALACALANPYSNTPGPGYCYQDTNSYADSDPDQYPYANSYADPRSYTPGPD